MIVTGFFLKKGFKGEEMNEKNNHQITECWRQESGILSDRSEKADSQGKPLIG